MSSIKTVYIKDLKVGMYIADPIYAGKLKKGALLVAGNTLVTDGILIKRLEKQGIKTVIIDLNKGIDPFVGETVDEIKKKIITKKALEISASEVLVSNTLLDQRRWKEITKNTQNKFVTAQIVSKLKKTFVKSVTKIFSKNITSRSLMRDDKVLKTIKEIIHFIGNNVDILRAVIRLNELNEYTFAHSVNTMVLTIPFANYLKYSHYDIKRLGIAVMLADLGMSNYHTRLTTRPSRLSKAEMNEINKHPQFTVDFLKNNDIDDSFINTLILQHHERFDGTGYPQGLKGETINPISRLFAIADVYDAMTSIRPFRPAIPPFMALAEMLKLSETHFDPKMANVFIKFIGVFPMGSMVELTCGHPALVASLNRVDPLKPLVIVFRLKKLEYITKKVHQDEIGTMLKRYEWDLVDLAGENINEYGQIKQGLDHRKYYINPEYYLNQV